jgi:hypothetical protein
MAMCSDRAIRRREMVRCMVRCKDKDKDREDKEDKDVKMTLNEVTMCMVRPRGISRVVQPMDVNLLTVDWETQRAKKEDREKAGRKKRRHRSLVWS